MERKVLSDSSKNNNGVLVHNGILGMRWGVRRYQNKDGTLTAEGKKHLKKNISYDEMERQSAFPLKGKNIASRKKVADEYEVEHNKVYEKYYDKNNEVRSKYRSEVRRNHGGIEELEKLYNEFIEKICRSCFKRFKNIDY